MKMVMVHHKDAQEPILVPECDLQSFAEKGWHPDQRVETVELDPVEESENIVDSEEIE